MMAVAWIPEIITLLKLFRTPDSAISVHPEEQ